MPCAWVHPCCLHAWVHPCCLHSHDGPHVICPLLCPCCLQVDGPCVMYIGEGGSGNFVKMVHNGIEYGDMQLISEAYDVLKTIGGLT